MFNNINFDYMENNNEMKKIDSSMVECPYCKNMIEAPDKPDVIFKCPKCHKELITYDKRKESQSKADVAENPKKTKQKKQIFICIAIFIALFSYFSFYIDNKHHQIGKWTDPVAGTFYELYQENENIFLNYSDIKTVLCNSYISKGKEYKFHDDTNGLFYYLKGTRMYIAEGFEECYDNYGRQYHSTVILIIQNNQLYVYSNDYDKNIYHKMN